MLEARWKRCGVRYQRFPAECLLLAALAAGAAPRTLVDPIQAGERLPARNPLAAAAESPHLVIPDCLTSFPLRRRLASERTGILVLTPDEGDRFEPGSIVARLRDEVPRAALAAAEARASSDVEIRQAIKGNELARLTFEKMQLANTRRPGTFDADELRQRQLETESASLRIEQAQHEFDAAQRELDTHRAELRTYEIRSEHGGIITRVLKHDGEGVQAAEEIVEIVQPNRLRVQGFAPASCRGRLRVGMPVQVRVEDPGAGGGQPILKSARLGFVDVALTSGGEVRVWAEVENPEGLLSEGLPAILVVGVEEEDVNGPASRLPELPPAAR